MKLVIKVGGTLLEDASERLRIAACIARHFRDGHQILLIHGGGKQLSRYLEKSGIDSRFVDGLRVTDTTALDGVVKVLAGTVNHELLAAFYRAELPAVGISGIDAGCLIAERLTGDHGQDWGFVGKVVRADPQLWEILLATGMLPVMACLAVGEDGQIYNINADQAAVACAVHLHADGLIFLTDVDGVRDRDGRILHQLPAEDIPRLIQSGAVTGGMLAKLNAVQEALEHGVTRINICNGHSNDSLDSSILLCAGGEASLRPGVAGTMVHASSAVTSGEENSRR